MAALVAVDATGGTCAVRCALPRHWAAGSPCLSMPSAVHLGLRTMVPLQPSTGGARISRVYPAQLGGIPCGRQQAPCPLHVQEVCQVCRSIAHLVTTGRQAGAFPCLKSQPGTAASEARRENALYHPPVLHRVQSRSFLPADAARPAGCHCSCR